MYGISSVEDASLEGSAETIVQAQVEDLHIGDADSEDEAPMVHDGGVFEEDAERCRRWGRRRQFVRFEANPAGS